MRAKLKLITGRSNGMGYERRKEVLHQTIRGWVNYFKLADAKKYLEEMDKWLRRRIRMAYGKAGRSHGHASRTLSNVVSNHIGQESTETVVRGIGQMPKA